MKTGRGWWALAGWTAITLGLLAAYPLSLGPVRWLYRGSRAPDILYVVYQPIGDVHANLPGWLESAYDRYLEWWVPPRHSEDP